jgi:hypothetical protein
MRPSRRRIAPFSRQSISLDQAALIAEFQDDDTAVNQIMTDLCNGRTGEHVAERLRQERAAEAVGQQLTAQLAADGYGIADEYHGVGLLLTLTFSSLAASFSWAGASHCCRSPASYQTARHRPPSDRAGYTVIPHSSSMTSPPPRVAARPVPSARARLRPVLGAFLGRPEDFTAGHGVSCGESVGILTIAASACVMRKSLFLRSCR